jgi:outer membrane protein assembly factor BamA
MQLVLKYVLVLLMILPCGRLVAQVDSMPAEQKVTIKKIHIAGNRKTKEKIILREISFKEGEQYFLRDLVRRFEDARKQLMNTILFHEVVVALKSIEGTDAEVLVEVNERWYLFPVPYFKFVDRNLNQWLFEQNARLDRVNYGIKVLHNNATGFNDKFNLWLINGYTKQVILGYDRSFIDKRMKWGASFQISFGKNREVNYATLGNKQTFFKDTNNFVRSFFRTNVELTHRPAIKTRHRFGIGYTSERVNDTIVSLNPEYFEEGRNSIKFGEVYYIMTYFDVDYIPYPLTGYLAEFSFVKRGFNKGTNMWQTQLKLGGGWKIANKTYFGARASGSIKLPFKQPFYNQRFLGYSDFFMQGYEYYVVDGVIGGYLKATVTRELFDFDIFYRLKKGAKLERIPFRFFARIYANAGYAYNPDPGINPITNNMMYSSGIGLDVLTLYDLTLRVEWSVNRLGENGVYLHRKINF